MDRPIKTSADCEKEFTRIFEKLSQKYSSWVVWEDFVTVSAASIANAIDKRPGVWHKRENEYLSVIRKYRKDEQSDLIRIFTMTVLALDINPAQDFLGKLYMNLGLSNHWRGQFFTPWSVSGLMSEIAVGDDLKERVEKSGYISMNDPACGAGSMIVSFANVCLEHGVNYQQSVFFVGQDIDPVVAKMCYIQTSLIGCPGYVVIGNSITEPVGGTVLNPVYKRPENLWFTPLYFLNVWAERRAMEAAVRMIPEETVRFPVMKSLPKGKRPNVSFVKALPEGEKR